MSKAPKPVLIATGRRSFTRAGHAHMTIKLTQAGTRNQGVHAEALTQQVND